MPLSTFPVAEKMSWAANRQTTRPEDTAYCLLGIFDVNMPLLYGEGERAFSRLQEEIMKRSNDNTIFFWTPSWPEKQHFYGMLARSPKDFDRFGDGELEGLYLINPREFLSGEAFDMTNKGIRLKTTLRSARNGNVMMLLDFTLFHEPVAVLLRLVAPNTWARLDLVCGAKNYIRELKPIEGDKAEASEAIHVLREVDTHLDKYLLSWPTYAFILHGLPGLTYLSVTQINPIHQYDKYSRTLYVQGMGNIPALVLCEIKTSRMTYSNIELTFFVDSNGKVGRATVYDRNLYVDLFNVTKSSMAILTRCDYSMKISVSLSKGVKYMETTTFEVHFDMEEVNAFERDANDGQGMGTRRIQE
jgi:hypothetical protein